MRAYADGKVDINFLQDRYNHAVEHLSLLASEGTSLDDHIAAVAWFLDRAVEAEELGLCWKEIMAVTTPEDNTELRSRIIGRLKLKSATRELDRR